MHHRYAREPGKKDSTGRSEEEGNYGKKPMNFIVFKWPLHNIWRLTIPRHPAIDPVRQAWMQRQPRPQGQKCSQHWAVRGGRVRRMAFAPGRPHGAVWSPRLQQNGSWLSLLMFRANTAQVLLQEP